MIFRKLRKYNFYHIPMIKKNLFLEDAQSALVYYSTWFSMKIFSMANFVRETYYLMLLFFVGKINNKIKDKTMC